MAVIAKSGTPSLATNTPGHAHQIGSDLKAGEAIAAGDVCYIKSDGLVWKSNGTSANAAAVADGIAPVAASVGEAVTLLRNVDFYYGSGMTPGARIYVFTTAGTIGDAATTGGTAPIGFAIDATRIRFNGSGY